MKIERIARPVAGFRASGIHCGIKDDAPDLALIVSDEPANVAAVFTQSTVVGAAVEISRQRVQSGKTRGVVVNSGISNVAMGERGLRDAREMAALAAAAVGAEESRALPEDAFLMASTGVIGRPLPMPTLRAGIPKATAALSSAGFGDAAEAIRTTDTHAKIASTRMRLGGRLVTLTGIAKGSGMIEPDMATMLSFIATDAKIAPSLLRGMLRRVADATYNRLTIDGEGSTSDTVVLMASGRSDAATLRSGSPEARRFERGLMSLCEDLVRQLARDGEGATKLLTVCVRGARNAAEADRAARRIGNSLLVKTAVFGGDPNWGRILQTIGAGKIDWDPSTTRIKVGGVVVYSRGSARGEAAVKRAEKALIADEIEIEVELGRGNASARLFTCDLTYDYVRINAEYTT